MVHRKTLAAFAGVLLVTAPLLGDNPPAVAEKPLRYSPKVQAGMLLLLALSFGEDPPAVAEKPLRYWVLRLLDDSPKVRELAVERINRDYPDAERWVFGNYSTDVSWLFDQDFCVEADVFRSNHKSLAPLLLKVMKNTEDDEVFQTAALVAAALGPEATSILPGLRQLAEQNSLEWQNRLLACTALLFVMPEDQAVGPIILKCLDTLPKEMLSHYQETGEFPVISGLLAQSGHTKVEVPYLCKIATGDYPVNVRVIAIETLGALEFDAKAAVPMLHQLLQDEDHSIRTSAALSLVRIEQDKNLVPVLVKELNFVGKERREFEQICHGVLEFKMEARKLLKEMDKKDHVLLPMFDGMLTHGNGFYRRQAIRNLAIVGPEARQVLPLLKKSLNDPDEETRQLAADAIKKIEAMRGNAISSRCRD